MSINYNKQCFRNEQYPSDILEVDNDAIMQFKGLNYTAKSILKDIIYFDAAEKCFAGNIYFAKTYGVTRRTISLIITKLKKLGLVEQISFDGRQRVLGVTNKTKELFSIKEKIQFNTVKSDKKSFPSERKDYTAEGKFNDSRSEKHSDIYKYNINRNNLLLLFKNNNNKLNSVSKETDRISMKTISKTKKYEVSDRAKHIVDYWNDKKLVHHKEGTKTYQSICETIDKIYDNKFDHSLFKDRKIKRMDFIKAIDNFALSALNDDYEPVKRDFKLRLKKTSLLVFLFNERSNKSCFLLSLDNNPKKAGTYIKKEITPVVKVLAKEYAKIVKDKDDNIDINFTAKDWYNFEKTEQLLVEFINKHEQNIKPTVFNSMNPAPYMYNFESDNFGQPDRALPKISIEDKVKALVYYLVESVKDTYKKTTFVLNTGWLCSEQSFNTRLPNYLASIGLWNKNY